MNLSFLKTERVSQRSYFGFLSLDLLDFLMAYVKPSVLSFRGRLVRTEHKSYVWEPFECGLAAFDDNYYIITDQYGMDFHSHTQGRLYRHRTENRPDQLEIKGDITTFFLKTQFYTFNFRTRQLVQQPHDLPERCYKPLWRNRGVVYWSWDQAMNVYWRPPGESPILIWPNNHSNKHKLLFGSKYIVTCDWNNTYFYHLKARQHYTLSVSLPSGAGFYYSRRFLRGKYLLAYKTKEKEDDRQGMAIIDLSLNQQVAFIALENIPPTNINSSSGVYLYKNAQRFCLMLEAAGLQHFYE